MTRSEIDAAWIERFSRTFLVLGTVPVPVAKPRKRVT